MKKIVVMLMFVMLVFLLGLNVQAKNYTLKFSTASVPNDAHTQALSIFKDSIEKLTDGQVQVKIFHSSSLYPQGADFDATKRGNLEMVYTSAWLLADYIPYLNMFTAGYLYQDYQHMAKVLNGPIGEKVFNDVAKKLGVRPLAAFYIGARQLNLRGDKRIETPEDLKGTKLRMPATAAWLFLGKALGANPTPIAFSELYMALNTGTVDGQDNPLPTDKNAKFYEVTDQIILTNHFLDSVWFTINEELWQEMGADLKAKMKIAVEKAREYCDRSNLKEEKKLADFFKEKGLQVYEPDINSFRSHVQKAYLENKEMTSSWDMKIYQEVQALVD